MRRTLTSRPVLLLLGLLMAFGLLAGCNKRCVCTGYNFLQTTFSQKDVEQAGTTCHNMVWYGEQRRFSLCEWEY